MDLDETIRQLKIQKHKLDRAIAELEKLQTTGTFDDLAKVTRRGRKVMSPEERQQVSKRMKRYWARRREDPKS